MSKLPSFARHDELPIIAINGYEENLTPNSSLLTPYPLLLQEFNYT